MIDRSKKLPAFFYETPGARACQAMDQRTLVRRCQLVGRDVQKVEFAWPLGMPYCRSLGSGLWEVRSDLTDGKIGRVIFCVLRARMVLLHGFIKKTQKTPAKDMELALKRMREVE
jgi:phage-related protein